jgi:hypothetical protein
MGIIKQPNSGGFLPVIPNALNVVHSTAFSDGPVAVNQAQT